MKLSEWAKKRGISYLTAYRWAKKGIIENLEIMPNGTILVNDFNKPEKNKEKKVVVYARVSSHIRKKNQKIMIV